MEKSSPLLFKNGLQSVEPEKLFGSVFSFESVGIKVMKSARLIVLRSRLSVSDFANKRI